MDIGLKTPTASARGNTGITGKKARGQLSDNQTGQQALHVLVSPQRRNSVLLDRCLPRAHWIGKRRQTCARTHGRDNSASSSPTTDPATTTTTDLSGPPPLSPGPPPSRPPAPRPHPPYHLHPLSPPAAPMQDSSRHASLPDTAEEEEAEPARTDDAGPAPQRGRPERGEARELWFSRLQMRANPANPWVWQERPYQGQCRHTCSSVRKAILKAKKG